MSPLQLLQVSHQWRFGRTGQLEDDHAQFILHGVIPKYALEFLKHMQEGETYGGLDLFSLCSESADEREHRQIPLGIEAQGDT